MSPREGANRDGAFNDADLLEALFNFGSGRELALVQQEDTGFLLHILPRFPELLRKLAGMPTYRS